MVFTETTVSMGAFAVKATRLCFHKQRFISAARNVFRL